MDCRYVRERLAALMFDELDARELQVMQPHMGSCDACQREYQATIRSFRVVQAAVRAGGWVPDRFTETVVDKLAPRNGKRLRHDPFNMRLMRRMVRLALCILAGVSLVGLYVVYSDHLPHFARAADRIGHGRDIFGEHAARVYRSKTGAVAPGVSSPGSLDSHPAP